MIRRISFAMALMTVCGCGKPTLYPVSGEVKIAAKPAPGVRVFFAPGTLGEATPSTRIGFGVTDADGRFKINCSSGEEGLERGTYHVTFSRPLARGKSFGASERPDGAVESVPPPYSDHKNPGNSPITASVPSSASLVLELPMKQ